MSSTRTRGSEGSRPAASPAAAWPRSSIPVQRCDVEFDAAACSRTRLLSSLSRRLAAPFIYLLLPGVREISRWWRRAVLPSPPPLNERPYFLSYFAAHFVYRGGAEPVECFVLWFCVSRSVILCDRHRPSRVHPYRLDRVGVQTLVGLCFAFLSISHSACSAKSRTSQCSSRCA